MTDKETMTSPTILLPRNSTHTCKHPPNLANNPHLQAPTKQQPTADKETRQQEMLRNTLLDRIIRSRRDNLARQICKRYRGRIVDCYCCDDRVYTLIILETTPTNRMVWSLRHQRYYSANSVAYVIRSTLVHFLWIVFLVGLYTQPTIVKFVFSRFFTCAQKILLLLYLLSMFRLYSPTIVIFF